MFLERGRQREGRKPRERGGGGKDREGGKEGEREKKKAPPQRKGERKSECGREREEDLVVSLPSIHHLQHHIHISSELPA